MVQFLFFIEKAELIFDDPIVQQEELANTDIYRVPQTPTQPNLDSTMNTMMMGLGDSQVIGELPMVVLEGPDEDESGDTPKSDTTTRFFAEFGQE
jgi:hypothetical protein